VPGVDLAPDDCELLVRDGGSLQLADDWLGELRREERDLVALRSATAPSGFRETTFASSARVRTTTSIRSPKPSSSSRSHSRATRSAPFRLERTTFPLCRWVRTSPNPRALEQLVQRRHRDPVPRADVDAPEEHDVAR